MATTTNYSWTTPDDTALVKDGAAAIRTLGSSVDTTVKNLNPETTLGDIAYRSSTANVNTRLGLGTAGQVLTVNSGATAPEWSTISAGGMTLLSTTNLSGSSTTISSISGSYVNLFVMIKNLTQSASNDILVKFNTTQVPVISGVANGTAFSKATGELMANPSTNPQIITFTIGNYSDASFKKTIIGSGYNSSNSSLFGGYIADNNAITNIVISCSPSTFSAGSVLIYGVK